MSYLLRESHLIISIKSDRVHFYKVAPLSGLSIGFVPVKWEYDKNSKDSSSSRIRRLKKIDLWEVSLVTFPANDAARVTDVKSATLRDIEETLRDAGFSRNEAARLIARIKDIQRDAELKQSAAQTAKELIEYLKGK